VQLAAPLAAAASIGARVDGGANVPQDFFVVIASIVPVFLLALMVELAGMSSKDLADRLSEVEAEQRSIAEALKTDLLPPSTIAEEQDERLLRSRTKMRETSADLTRVTRSFFFQAGVAEAACLYAIGSGTSSAFLVALACAELVAIGVNLLTAFEVRIASSWREP
jgi:hypothetical protein